MPSASPSSRPGALAIAVEKETFPLSAYTNGTGWEAFGGLNMSAQSCIGTAANNTPVNVKFAGMDRENTFLPSDFQPGGMFEEVSTHARIPWHVARGTWHVAHGTWHVCVPTHPPLCAVVWSTCVLHDP